VIISLLAPVKNGIFYAALYTQPHFFNHLAYTSATLLTSGRVRTNQHDVFFQDSVPCMVEYLKPNQIEGQFVRHPETQWLFAGMHTS
jgi:hypothetical protein